MPSPSNLAERLDRTLVGLQGFSSAREQAGRIWVAAERTGNQRARAPRSVASDLRRRLEESGFEVSAGRATIDGRVIPAVRVHGFVHGRCADRGEEILVVSASVLERFRSVRAGLRDMDRQDTSYANVRKLTDLVQQGIFLSRRQYKDNLKRVERIREFGVLTHLGGPANVHGTRASVSTREDPRFFEGGNLAAFESVVERDRTRFGTFLAMSIAWEVHVAGGDEQDLRLATSIAAAEVRRIEACFARDGGGIVQQANEAAGHAVTVGVEAAGLLDLAHAWWVRSAGRFDITSAALGPYKNFEGSSQVIERFRMPELIGRVGWQKVRWNGRRLRLQRGMRIDLGPIAKAYAVDQALTVACAAIGAPVLVIGGGHLATNARSAGNAGWALGQHHPACAWLRELPATGGGIATSGPIRPFPPGVPIRADQVIDVRTGQIAEGGPRGVTVADGGCSEAAAHSTIARLLGADAEAYLQAQPGIRYWLHR